MSQYGPGGGPPGGMPMAAPQGEGNLGIGIALGFILGCFGLIGCLIWGKPLTKKGAWIGFGVAVVISIIANVAMRA